MGNQDHKDFTREELISIRERALEMAGVKGTNEMWRRAYLRLAQAADVLDAYIARTEVKQD